MANSSESLVDIACAFNVAVMSMGVVMLIGGRNDLGVITLLVMFAWVISGTKRLKSNNWRRESPTKWSLKDCAALVIWPLVLRKIKSRGAPHA